jgi:hypothetical protein
MHESETQGLVDCVDCGATISLGSDRGYAFGTVHVLCFQCAKRRGGRYDETLDDWSSAPDTADLPNEAEF